MQVENIFADLPASPGQERLFTLFESQAVKIDRIVSHSHKSPEGFWYDQPEIEWVIVLRGRALLEFENGEVIQMNQGDYLTIPSHVRHRITQTSYNTLWLAVHIKPPSEPG